VCWVWGRVVVEQFPGRAQDFVVDWSGPRLLKGYPTFCNEEDKEGRPVVVASRIGGTMKALRQLKGGVEGFMYYIRTKDTGASTEKDWGVWYYLVMCTTSAFHYSLTKGEAPDEPKKNSHSLTGPGNSRDRRSRCWGTGRSAFQGQNRAPGLGLTVFEPCQGLSVGSLRVLPRTGRG